MARKVDHARRKREIAEKSIRLFSQVGYENVSLIMVAAATGVSRTVLYRYFCSKREILDAAIKAALAEVACACTAVVLRREPALAKLEHVCHAVVDLLFKRREFVIAVFDFVLGMVRTGADMNTGIRDYTAATRLLIRRLLVQARRRGEMPANLAVERISDVIYSEFESCAMRLVLNTERDSAAARGRFSDIVHALSLWK